MKKFLKICLLLLALLLALLLLYGCTQENAEQSESVPESEPQSESSAEESSEAFSSESESAAQTAVESSYVEHLYKKDIRSINCYFATCTAVLNDGSAVFWGSNVYGGIGNGKADYNLPDDEKVMPSPPYRHCFAEPIIDAGSVVSSYALTESGDLYTWGIFSDAAETGQGDNPASIPTKVTGLTDIKQVSMATTFALALKKDGSVYHAGVRMELFDNFYDFDWNEEESEKDKFFTRLPIDFKCEKIASSFLAYVFLSDEGDVYVQGVLSAGTDPKDPQLSFKVPTKIDFPEKIVDIVGLSGNVIALSETGNVYMYGYPNSGISDSETDSYVSDLIYKKNLENIKSIRGTFLVAGALSESGEIYVWGEDYNGIIKEPNGDLQGDEPKTVSEPVKLDYQNITQFCIGDYNGTAISENGDIYIWGSNSIGQIIEFE